MGTDEIKPEGDKQLMLIDKKKIRSTTLELLYNDYLNDPELTAFTSLDREDFLETA
jgi:hypothetical protein